MKSISDYESRTQIRSVARASALLRLVAGHTSGVSATEAAQACGLALPTTYHLLNTLAAEGLLVKDARRRYALGPTVGLLADAYGRASAPPEHLRTAMRALADETGETAYLTAWRDDAITVLASCEGANAVRVAEVGRGPYEHPHARATGKLLLALAPAERRAAVLARQPLVARTPRTIVDEAAFARELATIRRRSFAEDRDEFVDGISCVAAPVLIDGTAIAAFTISAPSERFRRDRERLRDAVRRVAASVHGAAGMVA
jgi:IclR family acetate operon transcriptional repressor